MDAKLSNFCSELYHVGCIKFGNFVLKSGAESSYYFDLRPIISYPNLLEELCSLIYNRIQEKGIKFDTICGVPYTALPISTILSVKSNTPMVMRRKEAKAYGTKQLVEGIYKEGNSCLIIEDVISSGASILETVTDAESVGLVVKDVIVFFNREEQGVQNLKDRGYNIHCICSLSELVSVLSNRNYISSETVQLIENQKKSAKKPTISKAIRQEIPYEKRVQYCKSAAAAKIFSLMAEKKTNLCFSADVTNINTLLKLADEVGPHICVLKIHIDVVQSYSEKDRDELKNIAVRHNFLIMEDRKLADIGNTVRMQFNQISKWANLVTVHALPGFGVLEAIKQAETYNKDVGVFLIVELSSKSNLITPEYTKKSMALAESYPDLVSGVVCQFPSVVNDPGYIQMTPGVHIEESSKNDNLGQQYNSPEVVVGSRGADLAVVGRGIVHSPNPGKTAALYRERLWNAYLSRIK